MRSYASEVMQSYASEASPPKGGGGSGRDASRGGQGPPFLVLEPICGPQRRRVRKLAQRGPSP